MLCVATMPVLHLHHAAEAHEGHGKDTGGDEGDGNALHRGGKLGARKLLAYACEDHKGKREAYRDGDGIDDTFQERVFLLDDEDGDPEDAAVCRDEWQEDAEGLIERRRYLLQDDFDHLHEGGDDEDEGDGLHIDHVEGLEDELLQEEGAHRRECQDEGHGGTHTEGGIYLLRDTEEGTDTEELREDDIVDEDRRNEEEEIVSHKVYFFALSLFFRAMR